MMLCIWLGQAYPLPAAATIDVDYPLLQGQASIPIQAWRLAENRALLKLMSFAVSC